MNENDRDTHFQGFAKLLYDELQRCPLASEQFTSFDERAREIIARRAYDFAKWVYECSPWYTNPPYDSLEEQLAKVPDLTEWPTLPQN